MNAFDTGIIDFLNQFAHRSHFFDRSVVFLGTNDLLKGGVFMALLYWAWHRREAKADAREYLLSSLVMGLLAVFVARGLALALPFRDRPAADPGFQFTAPSGSNHALGLENWSAFPSDHAVLFFVLATGLLFVSRRVGVVALLYAAVVICLPRLYLGLHWPTDILAGAALGIGIGWVAAQPRVRRAISRPALAWHDREPGSFYAALFLLTYQNATLFNESRDAARFAAHTIKGLL